MLTQEEYCIQQPNCKGCKHKCPEILAEEAKEKAEKLYPKAEENYGLEGKSTKPKGQW